MLSLRRIATAAAPAVGRHGLQATSARIRLYSQASQDSQNSQAPQNSQASQDSQDSQADPYYKPPKYPNAVSLAYDLHHPRRPNTTWREDPILFLHGLFGSKKNNRTISNVLARDLGRYVYCLDLRNHGDSPHNPQHDYLSMADDVARFIEEHRLMRPTIIGHSMGAKTAMTLALREPELVANIIAVDNAPVDVTLSRDFAKYVRAMKKIDDANVTRQAEADKILSEYEESLPIRQFLLGNMYQPPGEKFRKFKIPLDILAKSLDNCGDFPYKDPNEIRYEKPALFVRGTKSKYVPDELLPLIGQFFPKFRLVDVDAGHWLISEQFEAFRLAVGEFLWVDNRYGKPDKKRKRV